MISEEEETVGRGLNLFKARKPSGSVLAGIKKLKSYTLVITPKSSNLKTELNNYVWIGNDVPIDKFNHLIDAIRYAVDYLDR